jgi:hypothetical protein
MATKTETTPSTSSTRDDPFGSLDDFQAKTTPSPKPIAADVIDHIAKNNNFPSRQPKPQKTASAPPEPLFERPRKKREPKQTVQINIRVGVADANRFYKHVDALKVDLSEFLAVLLDTYENAPTGSAKKE